MDSPVTGPVTYVAFLRAVNVGNRRVPMAELRETVSALGHDRVRTYIQTGNVFFDSRRSDRAALAAELERAIGTRFGFDVPVALRTVEELTKATELAAEVLGDAKPGEEKRFAIMFATAPVRAGAPQPPVTLTAAAGEAVVRAVSELGDIVVSARQVPGKALNVGTMVEKALGVTGTIRFAHTTDKILAAARSKSS